MKTPKVWDEYTRLLSVSTSADTLVRAARYASEKYIERHSMRDDQGRHQAVFDAAVTRVEELGHLELADKLRAEHRIRLSLLGASNATDLAANRITDPDEED